MSVSSISNSPSTPIQQASSGGTARAALAAAVEEVTESAATTRQEAAQGDQVAIRRLARQPKAQPVNAPSRAREPGKGERADHTA